MVYLKLLVISDKSSRKANELSSPRDINTNNRNIEIIKMKYVSFEVKRFDFCKLKYIFLSATIVSF